MLKGLNGNDIVDIYEEEEEEEIVYNSNGTVMYDPSVTYDGGTLDEIVLEEDNGKPKKNKKPFADTYFGGLFSDLVGNAPDIISLLTGKQLPTTPQPTNQAHALQLQQQAIANEQKRKADRNKLLAIGGGVLVLGTLGFLALKGSKKKGLAGTQEIVL